MTRQTGSSDCKGQDSESGGALAAPEGSPESKPGGGALALAAERAPGGMHGGSGRHVDGERRGRHILDAGGNASGRDPPRSIGHEPLGDAAARAGR